MVDFGLALNEQTGDEFDDACLVIRTTRDNASYLQTHAADLRGGRTCFVCAVLRGGRAANKFAVHPSGHERGVASTHEFNRRRGRGTGDNSFTTRVGFDIGSARTEWHQKRIVRWLLTSEFELYRGAKTCPPDILDLVRSDLGNAEVAASRVSCPESSSIGNRGIYVQQRA